MMAAGHHDEKFDEAEQDEAGPEEADHALHSA